MNEFERIVGLALLKGLVMDKFEVLGFFEAHSKGSLLSNEAVIIVRGVARMLVVWSQFFAC